MSQYLVLSHIDVQNANAIAGLTWGFPAITGFLGFAHALSRKLQADYDITLSGCAVISNKTHHKIYQPKPYADFEFLQSKNPPVLAKHKSSSPPIIEEGKMNLSVSLVIEIDQPLLLTIEEVKKFEKHIEGVASQMRLAGGSILNIKKAKLFSASTQEERDKMLAKIKRLIMPGFVLIDRSHYLQAHYATRKAEDDSVQLLDAWLDFSALRYKAIPAEPIEESSANVTTAAEWIHQPKPQPGWLVPLMTGYKAISELYDAGKVLNVRETTTPTRFVEAIHSVGEWKGAHLIASIDNIIWRYVHDEQWYCCAQRPSSQSKQTISEQQVPSDVLDGIDNPTLEDALNAL